MLHFITFALIFGLLIVQMAVWIKICIFLGGFVLICVISAIFVRPESNGPQGLL